MLRHGLYEQIINKSIRQELDMSTDMIKEMSPIDHAEASKVLSKYVTDIIEKGLDMIKDNGGDINSQVKLINNIVSTVVNVTGDDTFDSMSVDRRAEQLFALMEGNNGNSIDNKVEIIRPQTSLAHSSLFTGAIHEPQMFSELKKEIVSSNRIDMLVSFIKWSGLRLIIEELTRFTKNGGELRVITTSYMGATDVKAIEKLSTLPNTEIKISYDTKRTRLHAKTYVFYRETDFTTAYVGSSNLSNAAISSGLEWNVKIAKKDMADTIQKIEATFESYWNSSDFEIYDALQRERLVRALNAEKYYGANNLDDFIFDIIPYSYQQEILDKLEAERAVRGNYRNLIVAATGTGKTVISAFDYKSFRKKNLGRPCRLLFVAHREEILKQSLSCFRSVLKDNNFGEIFVGNYRPADIENLFISIQTFNSQEFTSKSTDDFYDYIVVDEFHHAAAPSYQILLTYYRPKILLGLTATPERKDGKSIIEYFNNRIAAEIRLPEAIDRKLLCPFQYFGVTDNMDLDSLKWSRGGYDKAELSNLYTINKGAANHRADMIIRSLINYITDLEDVKGLGFCVSIEHSKFMSMYFNKAGISSMHLTGNSPDEDRATAKKRLSNGEVQFIFVVDIYNEGVDIPEVNTVLFLRPTESLTIFLQQLGRGLRLAENKECLTVLDFIGQANKKYNFEEKFAALLSNSTKSIQREIKEGFVSVPKGCYIQLERKAKEYILNNIRSSYGTKAGLLSYITSFVEDSELELNLLNFMEFYHMDVRHIYARQSFSRLCVLAGVRKDFSEPIEELMEKAFARICVIDSRRWISYLLKVLPQVEVMDVNELIDLEVNMLQMMQFTIWQKSYEECGFTNLLEGFCRLKQNPVIFNEMMQLLQYNYDHIDFLDASVDIGFNCPLDLHCSYTRDQLLVAMDFMKPAFVQGGVKYLDKKKIDIFFVTLNKSDKDYSPSTMYKDFSINEWLFHWQSQSTTTESSPTGQRYINHNKTGNRILLFVREYKKNSITKGAEAYTYLGLANYVKHEGSRPMNITWKLDNAIPAKFLKKSNKLVG